VTSPSLQPDAVSLKERSVRGVAATAGAQAVRVLLQVGSVMVLSRLLSPAEFGIVAMVMPIIGIVMLFNEFGLNHAVVQRREITWAQLSALFWANLAISTGLGLLVIASAPAVAWFYGEPRVAPITASLSVLLVLGGLAAQPMALLSRQMRFGLLSAIDVAASVVGILAGVAGALAGLGAWALVAMPLGNAAAYLLLAWLLAGWRPQRPRREPGILALLRFGGSITVSNLVGHVANNVDKVMIGLASGPVALGLYERTGRLTVQPMWQAILPLARVAVPLLSRLQDDGGRYRAAYLRLLGAMLAATTPGIVCAIVLAEPVVVTLLGASWRDAAPILAAMAIGTLLAPVSISPPGSSSARAGRMSSWSGARSHPSSSSRASPPACPGARSAWRRREARSSGCWRRRWSAGRRRDAARSGGAISPARAGRSSSQDWRWRCFCA
jgi:PST family polysaccharide transporter